MSEESERAYLEELVAAVRARGATVRFATAPEGAGRHLGTMEGVEIVLYRGRPSHETWFTLAHLFGHLVQRTMPSPEQTASIQLIVPERVGIPLTSTEERMVHAYEYEAARLGRGLMDETFGGQDSTRRALYARLWTADYRYLVQFVATGRSGAEEFQKYFDAAIDAPREILPLSSRVNFRHAPLTEKSPRVVVV